MLRKKSKLIFIWASIVIFLAGVTPSVQAVVFLNVIPKKVNMGKVKISDYEAGYLEKTWGSTIIVRDTSNDWKVLVKTNYDNMGVIGDYAKPISDFNWKASGDYATQLTYIDLENYDVEVARGPQDILGRVYVDYKILLAWANDVPGDYNINVIYTLTTQ